MKLIIDIPKERLDSIKHFGIKQNEVSMLERALIIGTPLDDVKAEIKTALAKEGNADTSKAQAIALNWVLELLDNVDKAESEDKG